MSVRVRELPARSRGWAGGWWGRFRPRRTATARIAAWGATRGDRRGWQPVSEGQGRETCSQPFIDSQRESVLFT